MLHSSSKDTAGLVLFCFKSFMFNSLQVLHRGIDEGREGGFLKSRKLKLRLLMLMLKHHLFWRVPPFGPAVFSPLALPLAFLFLVSYVWCQMTEHNFSPSLPCLCIASSPHSAFGFLVPTTTLLFSSDSETDSCQCFHNFFVYHICTTAFKLQSTFQYSRIVQATFLPQSLHQTDLAAVTTLPLWQGPMATRGPWS